MNRIRYRKLDTCVIAIPPLEEKRLGKIGGYVTRFNEMTYVVSIKSKNAVIRSIFPLGGSVSPQYIRPLWIVPTRPRYPAYRAPYLEAYTREYRWLEMGNRGGN